MEIIDSQPHLEHTTKHVDLPHQNLELNLSPLPSHLILFSFLRLIDLNTRVTTTSTKGPIEGIILRIGLERKK